MAKKTVASKKAVKAVAVKNTVAAALAKALEAPKPAAKPEAKPAAKPEAKPDTIALHLNSTGRLCFGKAAAARIPDNAAHMAMAIDKGLVRIELAKKAADDTLPVRWASGRPYISATKQFKPLGFDGSRAYDIAAKPFGDTGLEFKLA